MHTWIEINKDNLINNYKVFSNLVGTEHVVPILKSNAYGHGLKEVTSILTKENTQWLGTNYLFEAKIIRDCGFKGRLLNVGPVLATDIAQAFLYNTEIFVGNVDVLEAWIAATQKPKIHIKFDTGMGRQGFLPEEAPYVVEHLRPFAHSVVGVCTHFANVEDVLEFEYADQQIQKFELALSSFDKKIFTVLSHAASSASTLIAKKSHFDLSRIGISMFGEWPSQMTRLSYLQLNQNVAKLKPVLAWHCLITTVKQVKKGSFVGYGCTYQAQQDLKVAVLPVGYYEGYPRIAGEHQSYVLIHGERCKILGRICMNMMIVDVSHLPQVAIGDKATLIGENGKQHIAASTLADWAQTIHYELLTRLNENIERRIV